MSYVLTFVVSVIIKNAVPAGNQRSRYCSRRSDSASYDRKLYSTVVMRLYSRRPRYASHPVVRRPMSVVCVSHQFRSGVQLQMPPLTLSTVVCLQQFHPVMPCLSSSCLSKRRYTILLEFFYITVRLSFLDHPLVLFPPDFH